MGDKRKICVITGTRAEYGLLYWLMKGVQADPELVLQVIVTGMHLSPEFGLTYRCLEEDGFTIDAKVEMLLSSDTATGTAKSVGLAVIGYADALERLKPDLVVVLGDRYEMLAAAETALFCRIPVAHIAGGDTTEGAFDEAFRHSITKMAHIHFVTNPQSAKRVCQLGEDPRYVFCVGNPGLDHLKRMSFLTRNQLEKELDFVFRSKNLLVTFHPVTLSSQAADEQLQELFNALDSLGDDIGVIFTKPNSDPEGRALIRMLDEYVAGRPNTKAYTSLGQLRYLSAITQVDAVVGNSSSGLYEVPSFGKPTVDIGDRQKGRLRATSVVHCEPEAGAIRKAIKKAFATDCSGTINPYGDGESSARMLKILLEIPDYRILLQKHFFEVGCR